MVDDRQANWLFNTSPKSHCVTLKNGNSIKVEELLLEQSERYFKDVIVDGVRVNIAMKTLVDDYLIVIGTHHPKKLFKDYKHRWSIETFRFGDPISINQTAWF